MSSTNNPVVPTPDEGGPESERHPVPTQPVAERATPKPPGPGFLAAVGWLVLLLIVQFSIVIVLAFGAGFVAGVLQRVPEFTAALENPLVGLAISSPTLLLAAVLLVGIVSWSGLRSTFGIRTPRSAFAVRGPRPLHVVLILALMIPFVVVSSEVSEWIADGFRRTGMPEEWIGFSQFWAISEGLAEFGLWTAVLYVVVFGALLPAVGEELYFRGFLGRGLVARWGAVRGVVLTSLLFGVLHIYPSHVATAFLTGLVLHAVYLWSRSLLGAILFHAVYNGLAFLWNYLAWQADPEMKDGHVPILLMVTSTFAAGGVLWLIYQTRVRLVTPDNLEWPPDYRSVETPPQDAGAKLEMPRLGMKTTAVVGAVYVLFLAALGWVSVR